MNIYSTFAAIDKAVETLAIPIKGDEKNVRVDAGVRYYKSSDDAINLSVYVEAKVSDGKIVMQVCGNGEEISSVPEVAKGLKREVDARLEEILGHPVAPDLKCLEVMDVIFAALRKADDPKIVDVTNECEGEIILALDENGEDREFRISVEGVSDIGLREDL